MLTNRRDENFENSNGPNQTRIVLNVGGTKFETHRTTLRKLPATRLSKLMSKFSGHEQKNKELFFDRHPGVFSQILNYYRTGQLHYPTNVCGPLFEEELSFWGIQREEVEPCCWMTYTKHRSTQETLQVLDSLNLDTVRSTKEEIIRRFGWDDDFDVLTRGVWSKWRNARAIVWQLFEEPHSSRTSKLIAMISLLFTIFSIVSFVLRTLPTFHSVDLNVLHIKQSNQSEQLVLYTQVSYLEINNAFDIIEWICYSWFSLELALRFIVSPSKRSFCCSILNWIDFLGIFWFFFAQLLERTLNCDDFRSALDLVSTIRVGRMFRLCTLHSGLKVIITSVYHSSSVLSLLIFFFFLGIMIAGSAIYYVERLSRKDDRQILSLIDGIWFAISTISTLGFGDFVPQSLAGMVLGAVTTIAGVLIIDLPMPIIVEAFANFNSHLQARQQLPKQRRRITPVSIERKRWLQRTIHYDHHA